MTGIKIPQFKRGNIVTAEMLEAVRELSMVYQTISYAEYSDGILTGCKITVNDRVITVGAGIVIQTGSLYYISEALDVFYQPSNEWMILQLVFGTESTFRNVTEREINAVITSEAERETGALEVCRFRLQEGAGLRGSYHSFFDLDTEFDTVNEIQAQWSGYGKSTVSGRLLAYYAKELAREGIKEDVDFFFCQQICQLNGCSMNRPCIELYLDRRLKRQKGTYTNAEIYHGLEEIIRQNSGHGPKNTKQQRREARILVD